MMVWMLSGSLHSHLPVTGHSSISLPVAVTSEMYSFVFLSLYRQRCLKHLLLVVDVSIIEMCVGLFGKTREVATGRLD